MFRKRLRGVVSELFAESMRTATLVGLAAIPVGALWISLFGTGSAAVVLIAGALVGVLYSDRPTPGYRAGARAGLFAPIPEAVVQPSLIVLDVWTWGANQEAKVFFTVLVGVVGFLFLWVVGALVCIAAAAIVDAAVDAFRGRLSGNAGRTR